LSARNVCVPYHDDDDDDDVHSHAKARRERRSLGGLGQDNEKRTSTGPSRPAGRQQVRSLPEEFARGASDFEAHTTPMIVRIGRTLG